MTRRILVGHGAMLAHALALIAPGETETAAIELADPALPESMEYRFFCPKPPGGISFVPDHYSPKPYGKRARRAMRGGKR